MKRPFYRQLMRIATAQNCVSISEMEGRLKSADELFDLIELYNTEPWGNQADAHRHALTAFSIVRMNAEKPNRVKYKNYIIGGGD